MLIVEDSIIETNSDENPEFVINKPIQNTKEIVFDQITYNGEIYYKDKQNGVWDKNANLVGAIIKLNKEEVVELFDRKINTSSDFHML